MPKGRPNPQKIRGKKLLRDLKRLAKAKGFAFMGLTGSGHYLFKRGTPEVVASSSPTDATQELKYVRRDMGRAS